MFFEKKIKKVAVWQLFVWIYFNFIENGNPRDPKVKLQHQNNIKKIIQIIKIHN